MKPSARRLRNLLLAMAAATATAAAILYLFRDNLVYYRAPAEVAGGKIAEGQTVRLGGMVKEGSIGDEGGRTVFILTDFTAEVRVLTVAALPSLFKENSGAVVEGSLDSQGDFVASRVLAKHDENYRPPKGYIAGQTSEYVE